MTAAAASSSHPTRLPGTARATTAPITATAPTAQANDSVSANTAVPAWSKAGAAADPVSATRTATPAAAAIKRPRAGAGVWPSIGLWCITRASPARDQFPGGAAAATARRRSRAASTAMTVISPASATRATALWYTQSSTSCCASWGTR